MRIHPWLAALSSVCLLIAAGDGSARAQQASSAIFEAGGFEDAVEGRVRLTSGSSNPHAPPDDSNVRGQSPGGVVFEPAYQTNNPAVLWPPPTPPSYQPYPQISPYYPPNVSRGTTYNRNGLWFREMLQQDRKYFTTLEYLLVRYRNPGNEVVGARPVDIFRNDPGGAPAVGGGGGGAAAGAATSGGLVGSPVNNLGLGGPAQLGLVDTFDRLSVGPGVWPFPIIVTNLNFTVDSEPDETLMPIRSLGFFDNHMKAEGMRARWGFVNEDESGMMITGWFGNRAREKFQAGRDAVNGIRIDQDFVLVQSPMGGQAAVFPRNGSLPLLIRADVMQAADATGLQGDLVTAGFTGVPQRYDILFKYEVSTFAAGGAIHLYHEPIYKRRWVSLRPTFGARYHHLDEQFRFRGVDSGFGYSNLTFGGAGAGAQNVPLFRPDSADLVPLVDNNVLDDQDFFLDSRLETDIDSHMAGPEVGFRYDFGQSKKFSVWGQSTFALLANHQRMQLSGDMIGDPIMYFLATGGLANNGIDFTDPDSGLDTDFFSRDTHTVASPMFEQSVFFDIAIFQHIPVLRELHFLANAQFRTGYTYTVIGNVARPAESITWRAFPDFPGLRSDTRKTWHTHNWSFAVNWDF